MVYFSFQMHSDDEMREASHYYYLSGLDEIELPQFKAALIKQGDLKFVHQWGAYLNRENSPWFFQMETNTAFMQDLQNEKIISRSNPQYTQWKEKRTHVNDLLSQSVTWSYSLKAGNPSLISFLSHMFLHADISHLLGNMVFLLAVGFIVELAMNRYFYLACYLFCGICSALFYIPSASESLIPSLGASGAIAGLMGMYAVLFNTRKVRFFYFIYVYFDYVKLPAIYLLVLWLGFEVYQQIAYSSISNVNYLAHIGGLISGAFIAFLLTKYQAAHINHDYLNESNDNDDFTRILKQANIFIKELHHEKAVPLLAKLLAKQPENREVLHKYYKASKLDTGSEAYHHAALAILSLTESDPATEQLILNAFNEYSKIPKIRLTASLINKLMVRFTKNSSLEAAETLARIMQQKSANFPKLPQHLWQLINKFIQSGQQEKANIYIKYLLSNYPEHQATQLAKNLAVT